MVQCGALKALQESSALYPKEAERSILYIYLRTKSKGKIFV